MRFIDVGFTIKCRAPIEFYGKFNEYVESKGMMAGGGREADGEFFFFVTSPTRFVTEQDKDDVVAWATSSLPGVDVLVSRMQKV